MPTDYETNTTKVSASIGRGGPIREESLVVAQGRLKELLGLIAAHHYREKDMMSAAIYAMALRQLSPQGHSGPFNPHDAHLHMDLNKLLGMEPPSYQFQACDSLLKMVKDELARHPPR